MKQRERERERERERAWNAFLAGKESFSSSDIVWERKDRGAVCADVDELSHLLPVWDDLESLYIAFVRCT